MAVRVFRHRPTARWLPVIQDAAAHTPGVAYVPGLAREYGLRAEDVEVVVMAERPADLDTNVVPRLPKIRPLPLEADPVFRATVLTLLEALNVERAEHARAPITPAQFVAAVRAKL